MDFAGRVPFIFRLLRSRDRKPYKGLDGAVNEDLPAHDGQHLHQPRLSAAEEAAESQRRRDRQQPVPFLFITITITTITFVVVVAVVGVVVVVVVVVTTSVFNALALPPVDLGEDGVARLGEERRHDGREARTSCRRHQEEQRRGGGGGGGGGGG